MALFGVLVGMGVAVGLSLLNLVRRAWYPYAAVLGRVDGLKGYHDVTRLSPRRERSRPGALPLGRAAVLRQRQGVPRPCTAGIASSPTPVRWVVVAAEPMTDLDTTAADVLSELEENLMAEGASTCASPR